MLQRILLLVYTPIMLEIIRTSYEPARDYVEQQLSEWMKCQCRVCQARRKLGQNTFH